MPPAPPLPRSASRRTSSQHGHGGRRPSSPPPLLPSSLTPERSHRAPFDHPSNVTAGDFSLHHGVASVVGAAASPRLRHFYSEHKPLPLARVHLQARRARRTAEQASGMARATLQAEAAALGADVGGSGCLSGALASVPEWWPRRALASRLSARRRAALPLDTAARGRTASQLPSEVDGTSFTVHPWQPWAIRS